MAERIVVRSREKPVGRQPVGRRIEHEPILTISLRTRPAGTPAATLLCRGVPGLLAKLDHCVIHVSDWAVSTPFYRDVLGAELTDRGDGTSAYRFGTAQLNVHGPGVAAGPVARIPVAPGNSDLCFEWDGPIEGAVEHLERHGVDVEVEPSERSGARGHGTSVYFRDPDGSLLEFISYTA